MQRDEFVKRVMGQMDAVHRFAYRVSPGREIAEAIVYETYELALKPGPVPESAAGNLRLWLFELLWDVARTRLGDDVSPPTPFERMLNESSEGAVPVAAQTPCCYDLSTLDWEEAGVRLIPAINELPPSYRVIFLLWAVERFGYRQIAQILRLPVGTVRTRLYRARMVVSTELGELASVLGFGISETQGA